MDPIQYQQQAPNLCWKAVIYTNIPSKQQITKFTITLPNYYIQSYIKLIAADKRPIYPHIHIVYQQLEELPTNPDEH